MRLSNKVLFAVQLATCIILPVAVSSTIETTYVPSTGIPGYTVGSYGSPFNQGSMLGLPSQLGTGYPNQLMPSGPFGSNLGSMMVSPSMYPMPGSPFGGMGSPLGGNSLGVMGNPFGGNSLGSIIRGPQPWGPQTDPFGYNPRPSVFPGQVLPMPYPMGGKSIAISSPSMGSIYRSPATYQLGGYGGYGNYGGGLETLPKMI